MKTVRISLNTIDLVKDFVSEVTRFDAEFDLVSGRYVIDGGKCVDCGTCADNCPMSCISQE